MEPKVLVMGEGHASNLDQIKEVLHAPEHIPSDVKILDSIAEDGSATADTLPDSMEATVMINPETGEQVIVSAEDELADADSYLSEEEKKEIEDRILRQTEELDHLNPTHEEMHQAFEAFSAELDMTDVSDIAVQQIISVVKRIQAKEKFNVYQALPLEVQEKITQAAAQNGLGGLSVEAKTARNRFTEVLMTSFINSLQIQKIQIDLQKELAKINNEFGETMMGYALGQEQERHKLYESYVEKYEKNGDHERAERVRKLLDRIHDGYTLNPLKEAASNHKIKIKKFDLEKPNRVIGPFLLKYEKSTQNIYSPYTAAQVLYRNAIQNGTPLTREEVFTFFIAFAKFCRNYMPTDPFQHAFVYYVLYNCMMLDYKGKEEKNQDFINGYLSNVREVVTLLRGDMK